MAVLQQFRYYSSDALATTLTASLGPTGNPSVNSIAGLPTSYPYTMLIDWGLFNQEAISVTSAPTGGGPWTLPCTRGIDGSTGGSGGTNHSSGAVIVHGVTEQDFQQPVALASGVSGFPWEFNVVAYGAVGNGQVATDGAMNSVTSTTTLTCATSTPFTAADVGKSIIVNGAGTGALNLALVATISTFVSSSQVTLSTACLTTVSGAYVLWGTDDTVAFQNTINAAVTWMEANGYARVLMPTPPGTGQFYMIGNGVLGGALVTTGGANSQLVIPYPSNTGIQPTLHFYAPVPSVLPLWSQTVPQLNGGIVSTGVFASTAAQTTSIGSFGPPSVLGGTPSAADVLPQVGGLPAFGNVHVVCENWSIVTPSNDHGISYTPFGFQGVAKATVKGCASLITTNYNDSTSPNAFPTVSVLTNGQSFGILLPGNGNNAEAVARDCTASGYAFSVNLAEEIVIDRCLFVGNGYGLRIYGNDTFSNAHLMVVMATSIQKVYQMFQMSGASGGHCTILADIDTEVIASSGSAILNDINSGAALATLYGTIRICGNYSDAKFAPLYPVNVKMISESNTVPGWVFSYAGFSTAGTTVAVQNPYWRDARVYWSGGTVTSVTAGATIGGTGGSATTPPSMTAVSSAASGNIDWPSGGWLAFTFTGSPTWNVTVL